jgi:hypothetical protein
MIRYSYETIPAGTPSDLVDAARLGARIATRRQRSAGCDEDTIRREVVARFRETLRADHSEYARETLMVAVQRGIEDVLG